MYTNFIKLDTNTGGGIAKNSSKDTKGIGPGDTFPLFIGTEPNTPTEDEKNMDDDDLRAMVKSAVKNKIDSLVAYSNPIYRTDVSRRGRDPDTLSKNPGRYSLMEAVDHTNKITQGMVTGLTYNNNKKNASLSGAGNALFIRNRPGRISGDVYFSRAPLPFSHEDDENIWSLSELDPNNAMKRQKNLIKYIRSLEDI